jgi:hypothetical protein
MFKLALLAATVTLGVAAAAPAFAQSASGMSFFVTSAGPGKGGDLGGLAGADAHCQALAQAAGAGNRTWRAYLSADAVGSSPAVNARDRIGSGPWSNAKGVVIATSVADLHSASNKLTKETALTEKGEIVKGRGDTPNEHDGLTGSNPDGTLAVGKTCKSWTSSSDGVAVVGHIDRIGLRDDDASKSWNASHDSRACDGESLKATGGNGYFYCFAAR